MAIRNVTFDKKKGNPMIEILIGQAHHGSYRVYLWDSDGKTSKQIGSGINWDEIEDVIDLGQVNSLQEQIITWEVAVSGEEAGPGQRYSVRVTFKQDGTSIADGIIEDSGSLDGSKFVYGARKLIVS